MSLSTNLIREKDIRNFLNAKPGIEDVEGVYKVATGTITNAQMQALSLAVTHELVPAPGAGKFVEFMGGAFKVGAVAFTADADSDMQIRYTNQAGGVASRTLEATTLMATSNGVGIFGKAVTCIATVNAPLVLLNIGAAYEGTGSNCTYNIIYRIVG